ncbi:MAG: AraC family transcriptional regulator [Planctomycetota bacterium]
MIRPEIVFLHADEFPRCTAHIDKPFGYHTLQLVSRGDVVVHYDDRRHELSAPATWPAMPGPRRIRFHASRPDESWHHRYAAFAGTLVEQWRDQGLLPTSPQALDDHTAHVVGEALDETIAQVNKTLRWSRLKATNALERALIALAEARSTLPSTSRPAWLAELLDRLADAEGPEPDLAHEADRLAMGLTTLRRQIGSAVGMPPTTYRLAHKLAAARRLLVETDEPIKAIARRLGYCDVYHFTRHFSRGVGVSPARFRDERPM